MTTNRNAPRDEGGALLTQGSLPSVPRLGEIVNRDYPGGGKSDSHQAATAAGSRAPSPCEAVLRYATEFDWSVFPCHTANGSGCSCGKADCSSPGKHPRTKNGVLDATRDEETIRRWWSRWPDANVAHATGASSGVVVLDVDAKSGGFASLEELQRTHGALPPTWTSQTGGGGKHLFFRHPGVEVRNSAGRLRPGLDVRGDGGYVLLPPSRHVSGCAYGWGVGHEPGGDVELAELPQWLLKLLTGGRGVKTEAADTLQRRIPDGERNSTLASRAGTMRRRGMSEEAILAALLEENSRRCDPPLDDREVERIASSIARYEPAEEGPVLPSAPMGQAERFRHDQWIHLVDFQQDFLDWKGGAYRPMDFDSIKADAYKYLNRCRLNKFDDRAKPDGTRPFKPTRTKVAEVLEALKAIVHLPPDKYSPPCWINGESGPPPDEIISFPNGLLHVPSGDFLPPTPNFFTFNALEFDYDRGASSPERWEKFLRQLWPEDDDCIRTLQEIMGYLLIPDTSLQKAFLLVGPKRSGKGTIGRVINALIGKHNICSPSLNSLGNNFGLQPLLGKQVATVSDMRIGERTDASAIAETLLRITGEDAVTVARKFKEAVTLTLPTRFVVMTNMPPRWSDTSGALVGRFICLPMTRSFYGNEDPKLTAKLLRELPGILLWAIEGWKRLRERGHFVQPKQGEEIVQTMTRLATPIPAFVASECEFGPDLVADKDELFARFREWYLRRFNRECSHNRDVFLRDLYASVPDVSAEKGPRPERKPVVLGLKLKTTPTSVRRWSDVDGP